MGLPPARRAARSSFAAPSPSLHSLPEPLPAAQESSEGSDSGGERGRATSEGADYAQLLADCSQRALLGRRTLRGAFEGGWGDGVEAAAAAAHSPPSLDELLSYDVAALGAVLAALPLWQLLGLDPGYTDGLEDADPVRAPPPQQPPPPAQPAQPVAREAQPVAGGGLQREAAAVAVTAAAAAPLVMPVEPARSVVTASSQAALQQPAGPGGGGGAEEDDEDAWMDELIAAKA